MKKRILLSEDDSIVREMLGRILEMEGYAVDYASAGREAISQFIRHPADMVLLDLNMSGGHGWEAYDLINQAHPLVPVIVITVRPQQCHHAADLGIDGLMEPLNLALLLEIIKNYFSESEPNRVRQLTSPLFRTVLLNQNTERQPQEIFNESRH